jgi:SAM-dependent methyltransferase
MTSEEPKRPPTITADDWNRRYREADLPWDSGLVSRELRRVVESGEVAPGTAIELGCGTGTNAVWLAEQGFNVTAVDLAPLAIELAEARARAAGVAVRFVVGDVTRLDDVAGPLDFVFDRGCYHCVRRAGLLGGYLATVRRLTTPGARLFVLAGNPDAKEEGGPPKVTAAELVGDFEPFCRVERLTAFRFEDSGGIDGPLGWSCLLTRR